MFLKMALFIFLVYYKHNRPLIIFSILTAVSFTCFLTNQFGLAVQLWVAINYSRTLGFVHVEKFKTP